jgi:polyisoprenoid-binding protein YceI
MKGTINKALVMLALTSSVLIGSTTTTNAQSKFQSQAINIKLQGTSTLHDWEMIADKGNSEAVFVLTNDKLTSLSGLTFTLPAKNLKSEHTVMDNNTYKALKADQNPNITFVLTSAIVAPVDGNTYQLRCVGRLTIAGTTRETELTATGKYNPADKTFTVAGSKKMRMTDYQVKPPTVMFGTIKTGDDITISYNLKFTR